MPAAEPVPVTQQIPDFSLREPTYFSTVKLFEYWQQNPQVMVENLAYAETMVDATMVCRSLGTSQTCPSWQAFGADPGRTETIVNPFDLAAIEQEAKEAPEFDPMAGGYPVPPMPGQQLPSSQMPPLASVTVASTGSHAADATADVDDEPRGNSDS